MAIYALLGIGALDMLREKLEIVVYKYLRVLSVKSRNIHLYQYILRKSLLCRAELQGRAALSIATAGSARKVLRARHHGRSIKALTGRA